MTGTEARQRARAAMEAVRRSPAVQSVARTIAAALVTGAADSAGPRPSWAVRAPRWLPFRVDLAIVVDLILTAIVLGATVDQLNLGNRETGAGYGDNLLTLVAVAVAAPLLLRNWWPLAAWRLAIGAMVAARLLLRELDLTANAAGAGLVLAFSLYSVAVRCDRRTTIGAWLVSVVTVLALSWDTASAVTGALLMGIPVLFGYNVRLRRQTQRALDERNRRLEETEVARTLLEERSRIARELHDVVAHHMSVIAIQAEAAPYKVRNPPPELAETFADIRASALAGLTELRRILGVLRSERQDEMDTVPQPGLDRLGELVSNARNTGLVVHTSLGGEPRPLPSGVELSAYRIVQEALSNAMRYSPGADVSIEVSYGAEVLVLKVTNGPPRGPGAPGRGGGGHGVLGMHERVTMLGGELTARATPDGGFAVTATFPLATGAA